MSIIGDLIQGVGGRKLVAAVYGFTASCGLLIFHFIQPEHWVTVSLGTVGAFIAAQGVVDAVSKAKGKGDP